MSRRDLFNVLGSRVNPSARVRVSDVPYRRAAEQSPTERAPYQRVVFPPYLYKLPDGRSKDFNVNNYSTVIAAGPAITVIPVSFALPGTMQGYVQIFGIYVLAPTANTNLTYALQINNAPVSGWDNIANPPGVANLVVQNFSDLQVAVPPGSVVSVAITNNNAFGPWTVGAKIAGWYHTEADERYYFGAD